MQYLKTLSPSFVSHRALQGWDAWALISFSLGYCNLALMWLQKLFLFFNVISVRTRIFPFSMFSKISFSVSGSNNLREGFYAHEFHSLSCLAAAAHTVIGQVPKGIGARQGCFHCDSLHNTATVISLAGISIFATCWLIQSHLLSPYYPKDLSWTYFVFLQAAGCLISWHHRATKSS